MVHHYTIKMFDPPHPGEIVRRDCLEAAGLSIPTAARGLGVSPARLDALVKCRTRLRAEMALRLEMAGWGKAESWLNSQIAFDLWHIRKTSSSLKVRRLR